MSQRAIIARRRGEQARRTPSFRAIVTALGYRVVDEREQHRQEHNRYNLGPGLVEELSQVVSDRDCGYVAVDNRLHPGQLSDLTAALAPATVRDCRGVVYERLADGGNRAAANRRDTQQLRSKRRRLVGDNRTETAATADLERRRQRLDEEFDTLRQRQRRRMTERQTEQSRPWVVVADAAGTATPLWKQLVENGDSREDESGNDHDNTHDRGRSRNSDEQTAGVLRPARPVTAAGTVGGHAVTIVDVPGTLGGSAAWYSQVTPGAVAALERATVVVCVGEAAHADLTTEEGASAATVVQVTPEAGALTDAETVETVRSRVADALGTTVIEVQLPYTDDSQALVSWLHDAGEVRETSYGDTIDVRVALSVSARERLETKLASWSHETSGTVTER